ncbi:MAG: sodium:proton antiporter, partial [Muribaculaceae bacterium]|nr:sodium:proton antiporter [Muribaculaceae bacterium]
RLVMTIFRFLVALAFAIQAITMAYSARVGVSVTVAAVLLLILFSSRRLRLNYNRIESKFIDNLNERELRRSGKKNTVVHDLHEAFMTVGAGCPFVGDRLMDSNLRQRYGVNVVGIQRDTRFIPIPGGKNRIYPGDTLTIIGTDEQIERLLPVVEAQLPPSDGRSEAQEVKLASILLSPTSPLIDKTPRSASLRDTYDALVVAVDRGDEHIDSRPDLIFKEGDVLWVVGNTSKISKLK